ncbi:hypothetical protein [Mesorhizobium sp. M8A.F.Ca.ET.165.01.1.1]|uniref:hypothetical protein n=1 Tax=Mesorhizobium sp. M8A.F.Ca.ET.165.01.1.1 TaxID=2563960 RepID=UPI001093EB62|nr:hypothetical protein [Mesorhizobium sp. M8A.F.Ca.ET.165.01.1.1]TGT42762.1 hypothetical protein EN808_12835 [Mesorhizobium sp. M8A.F.Ca.ET.165.01.1.1]
MYEGRISKADGSIQNLCLSIGCNRQQISKRARELGLSVRNRPISPALKEIFRERTASQWKNKPHPRGMLGKKHTSDALKRIAIASRNNYARLSRQQKAEKVLKALKTRQTRGILIAPRRASWKQAWHEVGGKRFFARSEWEHQYAIILERRKALKIIIDWEHEPDTFWFNKIKRGARSYTPDFKVTYASGEVEYHEIKGWMDDRSKTKIKRMRIYHPKVKLIVIEGPEYKRIVARGI